jgi:hypothetical protein
MKSYIFITTDGFTFQPNSEASEPDVENCQVLGYGDGKNPQEAFKNLIKNNNYLITTTFNEIISLELACEERNYFYLNDYKPTISV